MDFESIKVQWEELNIWAKLLIVVGISLGIAYLIYMFILSNKMAEKEKLQNDIQNLKMEFANIRRNATPEKRAKLKQQLNKVKEETELLKIELEKVKSKFLPKDDPQTSLLFITDITEKNNLILNRFVIKGVKDVYLVYNPATKKIEYLTQNQNKKEEGNTLSKVKRALTPKIHKKEEEKNKNKVDDTPKVHLKRVDMSINLVGLTPNIINFIKDVSYSNNYVRVESVSLSKGSKSNIMNANVELSSYFSPDLYSKKNNPADNNNLCKYRDIYNQCMSLAKKRKILKNNNKCIKLSDEFSKKLNTEDKNINSVCFAGCMEDKNFLKSIAKNCN